MSEAMQIALIGGVVSLCTAVIPKLIDNHYGVGKDIKEIKENVGVLKENDETNGDMIYQILDHLATNNNTGEMKRALNEYNAHFRHNKD